MPAKKKTTSKAKKSSKASKTKKTSAKKKVVASVDETQGEHEFTKKELPKKKTAKKKAVKEKTPPAPEVEPEEEIEALVVEEAALGMEEEVEEEKAAAPKKKATKKKSAQKSVTRIAPSQRMDDEQIERELHEIYDNGDGSLPDMQHFEKRPRKGFFGALLTLVLSLAVLGAITWFGYVLFSPASRFSEEDVILSISGEQEITSGQEVRYRIRYRNDQNIPLAKVKLQVRYPEGFVFSEADPAPTDDAQSEWELGSLEEHASGFIDIFGVINGDLEQEQSFRVFLNYIPANFSSEFQKVATVSTQVTASPVTVAVTGPEQVLVGAETEYVVTIENAGTEPIENIALVLDPDQEFRLSSSEPENDEENQYQWTIVQLEQEETVTLRGAFDGDGEEPGVLALSIVQVQDDPQARDYTLLSHEQEVTILQTDVLAGLVINGALTDFAAQPGEMMHVSVAIQNAGTEPIEDISASMIFDAPSVNNLSMFDWAEIDDPADGSIVGEQRSTQVRRGTITWDSFDVAELASIGPGEQVVIDFSMPLKDAEDIDLTGFTTHDIEAVVELAYVQSGEDQTLSSNIINMVVNSDTTIGVQDEVDGDTHTVTWIVNNTFHELADISVETDIFGDVSWDESALVVPAGEASYDADAQQLSWTVESMPTSVDVLALQFAVTLETENPSQTNLTSKVRFTATDVVTGETITLVGDEVLLVE